VVLFAFTHKSSLVRQGTCQHAPFSACHRMFYIRGIRSAIHVSRSVGGRLLPPLSRSVRSTGISFQYTQDRARRLEGFGWSCQSLLSVVIINVIKDIAYKSAAFRAVGHFSQEVREIELSAKVADE